MWNVHENVGFNVGLRIGHYKIQGVHVPADDQWPDQDQVDCGPGDYR